MNTDFLENTILFKGASAHEIKEMLTCLKAKEKHYTKGSTIYHAGDIIQCMGLVVWGRVRIESDDVWGNKSVLDSLGSGMVFAETYACLQKEPLMVGVIADEDCDILFLNVGHALQSFSENKGCQQRLVHNLLTITAQKNLNLSRHICHTSAKSIRGRLLSYLSSEAVRQGSHKFTIPFNRQQLADYLNVDRSALSNELGKMRKEGLLEVDRNNFCLMDIDGDL